MWGSAFLISIFCWSYALSQDCTTPSGEKSTCVPLKNCKDLYSASVRKNIPQYISDYLRLSQCGLDRNTPKVCCGRVPKKDTKLLKAPKGKNINIKTDDYSPEDSLLAPRDKCGRDLFRNRIFGGEMTDIDEFPWMVLLGYRHKNGFLKFNCGGSLLNHRYVLTAAHCITPANSSYLPKLELARLGEYDVSSDVDCQGNTCADPVQDILVASSYIHPDFIENGKIRYHDVAIVRLASRVTYTDYVQPICLGKFSERLINNNLISSGWGETIEGGSSNVKRKIKLKSFNKGECVNMYHGYYNISKLAEEHICTGGVVAEDMCYGDSGGPLMIYRTEYWEQVAVTSFGRGCGLDGWPGISTNITGYQDWINKTLQTSNK